MFTLRLSSLWDIEVLFSLFFCVHPCQKFSDQGRIKRPVGSLSLSFSVCCLCRLDFLRSHAKDNSFYSSSDSEDEDEPRKFHVEIKPVQPNNGAHQNRATIDELKASIGNIILSPSTSVKLRTPNTELTSYEPVALLLCCGRNFLCLSTLEGNRGMSITSVIVDGNAL